MTFGYVLDASWARHGWPAVKAAGFTAVSLYLSNDPSKNAKPADVAGLDAVGLEWMLNWESTTGRPLQGAGAGAEDARRANAEADALGYPDHAAIYYSCDTDSRPGQVAPYYAAAKAASKRPVGAYGGADTVVHLLWAGTIDFAWVANAGSWDHGVADVGAHLHQHYHTRNVLPTPVGWGLNDYDESVVLIPYFGQAGGGDGIGDMPLNADDKKFIGDQIAINRVASEQHVDDVVAPIAKDVNKLVSASIDKDGHGLLGRIARKLGA
jgi:hypothetical protein